MSFQLRISTQAQADIEEVLAWTRREFGNGKYEEYRELIRSALADVARNPELARRRPELHEQARTLHIGRPGRRARHLLLLRVTASPPTPDGVVEIGRLLYDGMDLAAHVPDEFGA